MSAFASFETTLATIDPTEIITVTAWPTKVPGLCAHEWPDGDGWCVTHARSGSLVCIVDGPEQAMHVAELIAERTQLDFTQSAADMAFMLRRLKAEGFRASAYGKVPEQSSLLRTPEHPRYVS